LLRVQSSSFTVIPYSVIPILYICYPNLFLKIVTSCWLSYSCRCFPSLWESQSVHTFRWKCCIFITWKPPLHLACCIKL
jgi:hypothetical protein